MGTVIVNGGSTDFSYSSNKSTFYTSGVGSVVITSLTDNNISGTFQFAFGSFKTITNGTFNCKLDHLPY